MLREMARALALISFVASRAGAQTVDIWEGAAPGSETWTQKETTVEDTPLVSVVFNVVTPTLTAYLPEKAKATGEARGRHPERNGHGRGRAPELRGDHLRCSLRRHAGHTEGAAADLPGLGAGRQPGPWSGGEVPRRLAGRRPQAGGSRLQRGRPRLRPEETGHHQRSLDRRVLL